MYEYTVQTCFVKMKTRIHSKLNFSVDSSALQLEITSNNSEDDFSPDTDEYDVAKDRNIESSTDDSNDSLSKTATSKRRDSRKQSNLSLQRNFSGMNLSFGAMPGYSESQEYQFRMSQNDNNSNDHDQENLAGLNENRDSMQSDDNSNDHDLGNLPEMNENTDSMQNDGSSNNREPAGATANHDQDEYNNFDLINSEEDEFPFDRRLRLAREAEEEEALQRRLLAPRNEIRRRNRQQKKNQTNPESIDLMREKQLKLLDLQIEYHKILIDNAKVTMQKEKTLLSQALSNTNANNSAE